MAILHTEYLILSALSYCVFKTEDIDKNVFNLLDDENIDSRERILLKNDVFSAFDFLGNWNIIENSLLSFLNDWYIVDILDKTDDGDSIEKSGFYGIAFGKKNNLSEYKEIVIAYRGSQLFPIKEAYRDFVETDLQIGLGKKPKQFDEGLELYKKIIERFSYKEVRLTGHSLGGGIAQYVALMSELYTNDEDFVPKTVTFNGIGILVEGMIKVEDFISLDNSYEFIKQLGHESRWDKLSKLIYSNFIKKIPKYIKNTNFILGDLELKSFSSQFFLSSGYTMKEEEISLLFNNLVTKENLESYHRALYFIENFKENKKFQSKVKNFAHSKDFTASFFPHIGRTIFIDKRLKEKENSVFKKKSLNLMAFQKEMMAYHLFDIFIPYISTNYGILGEKSEYYLSRNLSFLYVAAVIRKLIYEEKLSKTTVLFYYKSLTNVTNQGLSIIKEDILTNLKFNKDNFIYKEQLIRWIENSDEQVFKNLWFEIIDRLPSPYEDKDIYDYILYTYNKKNFKNLLTQTARNN